MSNTEVFKIEQMRLNYRCLHCHNYKNFYKNEIYLKTKFSVNFADY